MNWSAISDTACQYRKKLYICYFVELQDMSISRFGVALVLMAIAALAAIRPAWADGETYYESYGLTANSSALDLGGQPLGYPSGVLSAVIARDRILADRLAAQGNPLKVHAFLRGADMLGLLADGRLEAGLLGDMPTILSAARGDVWVIGLVKQSATAIVARDQSQVRNLAGKRIAYVEASSAHQTLLQGLSTAGLKESDVQLVAMQVNDMPEALRRGEIDAFAAWEPAPSVALATSKAHRTVFRGVSSDYFVIGKAFAKRAPQAADELVAAYVRAIEWMRLSQKNIEKAAAWVKADALRFSGKPSELPLEQIVSIVRRELLNVPSAPTIIRNQRAAPPLKGEFDFLLRLGKVPASGRWEAVAEALNNDFLVRVQTDPKRFETYRFDYRD